MPPAAQDNQGLKIAVAVFVTLSVILAVATYFGFSNASFYSEKFDDASSKASQAQQAQNTLQNQLNELKERAGYGKTEDGAVVAAITKDQDQYNNLVAGIAASMEKVYQDYKAVAGANSNPQVDEFINQSRTAATSFQNDPNRTQASAISRLIELMNNESQLLAAVAADYQATRKDLEAANRIAQSKVDVEVAATKKVYDDREAEARKFAEDFASIRSQLDELQTRNSAQATEITTLRNTLAQTEEDWKDRYNKLMSNFRQVREQLEKDENTLERADGSITYVDYTREEVRTTLTRRQGAREQLVFSVFDKNAPGLPTDSPKATIQLIRVDDQGSVGRIIKQFRTVDPIRVGDQVYSPAFGAQAQTFALIGKIDVDQDGRDDREDLKRMIHQAGGEIAYDLPPPGFGIESGELSPTISWYVLDDRQPFFPGAERNSGATAEEEQRFEKKRTDALQEARLAGIRPISISRLLDYIGYEYGSAVPGRTEARNPTATDRLLNPQGRVVPNPDAPAPGAEMPEGEGLGDDSGFGDSPF